MHLARGSTCIPMKLQSLNRSVCAKVRKNGKNKIVIVGAFVRRVFPAGRVAPDSNVAPSSPKNPLEPSIESTLALQP